jgi:hypothetical protein
MEGRLTMSSGLTEDDMRKALGLDATNLSPTPTPQPTGLASATKAKPERRSSNTGKARTPKIRVILRVSQEFEGETTLLTHDADTLSRFDAEQEARTRAKVAKYRYFELVSITPIE